MSENETQKEVSDEAIEERAAQLREADPSLTLVSAMIEAERQLAPKPQTPTFIDVRIPLHPRVSTWLFQEFAGHPTMSVAERVGAYCGQHLKRDSVKAKQNAREYAKVKQGEAVTVPSHMIEDVK